MRRFCLKAPSAALLMLSVIAPLSGCAAGKSFSIAMANPGALQTVFLVGDAGAPGSVTAIGAPVPQVQGPSAALVAASVGDLSTAATAPASAKAPAVPTSIAPVSVVSDSPAPVLTVAANLPQTTSAAVQAALTTATVQVSSPVVAVAAQIAPSTTAVQVSSPAAVIAAATVNLGATTGPSLQTVTPVASVVASAGPVQGVQLAVVATPSASVAPPLVTVATVAQAALGSVDVTSLSAPSPGRSTPTASVLKTLVTAATKKLKHG